MGLRIGNGISPCFLYGNIAWINKQQILTYNVPKQKLYTKSHVMYLSVTVFKVEMPWKQRLRVLYWWRESI